MIQEFRNALADASRWTREHRSEEALRATLKERGAYIYGAGGFGQAVAEAMAARGISLHGFIDTFVGGGRKVAGASCFTPDEIDPEDLSGKALIIAVNNFKVSVGPISEWARSADFSEVIFVPELPDVIDEKLGTYWQASRSLMAKNEDALARVYELFADQTSREIYAALVRYRITGLPADHPAVDREHQYFPPDLPLKQTDLHVVDCGAFPGDMVEASEAAGLTLRSWFAFEPDPANFVELGKVAEAAKLDCAALFPCGAADRTGFIRFSAGAADASRAGAEDDDDQAITVPVVRVDDCVKTGRIDLVKLDIEGFEAQAIDGMAGLLAAHKPRLAMAIYHKPADLWELPLKIAEAFPSARFAIRQHGYNGYDTVLYADL